MGMLLSRHYPKPDAKAEPARTSRRRKPKAPEQPPVSPYAELTDEQLAEAYATSIPDGTAEDRDAKVAELDALAAENSQPDNG